jgi:type IV pilus assembly protein PilY1
MITMHRMLAALLVAAAQVATLLASAPARAVVDIADAPLVVGSAVAPNLMFLLDDSGSMQWEVMPDENLYFSYYLFPPPNSLYGADTYERRAPTFQDTNIHNFFGRSPDNNAVFYNPQTAYRPWLTHTGASFGDASTTAAPYNPADMTRGTLNLTVEQTQSARWFANTTSTNLNSAAYSCVNSCNQSFWPITFYLYRGNGSRASAANYTKYQIRGTRAYKRDPITAGEVEVTSLAWPNGVTRTVAEETQNFANWFSYYRSRILTARAGASIAFGQLGENFRVGFRTINGSGEFLIPTNGGFTGANRETWFNRLLETDIDTSGTPLRTALNWAGNYFENKTGTGDPWLQTGYANPLTCRQSFTILTTDGYWSDAFALTAIGNSDGTEALPYRDTYSNTLADVAMHYYKRDLRTGIADNVPTSARDSATWQHMVTFGLSLGVSGTLNPATDLPDLTSGTRTWPNPALSSPAKLDDLWHATINGRGAFVNAADPQQFTDGLSAVLTDISERVASTGNVTATSTSLTSNTLLFQSRFVGGNWTGDLVATRINTDGTLATTPSWKASEHIPTAASRSIYTWSGTAGITFQWANLSASQRTAIGTSATLSYLRGAAAGEARNGGALRNRTSVLGDIVNSLPAYVGSVTDLRYERFSWTGASTYQAHRTAVADRREMVYVAANDGMLHAFDARTGEERFAYVPTGAFSTMKLLANPEYVHKFMNDGSPVVAEVYFSGAWRTVLIGTQGRGGKTVYALDVTNPDGFAANKVLWEYTHADLGQTVGNPVIARMNDGNWAVVIGNGYNSTNERAVLLVLDIANGALLQRIDTMQGSSTSPNGLAAAEGVDVDRDGDFDYFYAGDLLGNLWKFNMSNSDPSQWRTGYGTAAAPRSLFTARSSTDAVQPITGGVSIGFNPADRKLWIFFGTGRYLATSDPGSTATQTWYGLNDTGSRIGSRSNLAQRVILQEGATGQGDNYRVVSKPGDTTGGTSMSGKRGWYMDLQSPTAGAEGERIINPPVLGATTLFVSTLIPSSNPCEPGGRGWVLGVNPFTGGRQEFDVFDFNRDGNVDAGDQVTHTEGSTSRRVVGSGYSTDSLPGSPLQIGKQQIVGGSDGTARSRVVSDGLRAGRVSWKEIIGD